MLLREIFAVPSNETPAIVLAVSKAVAVAAFPEVSWFPEVLTPGKFIFPVPSNDTPPIFRAVSRAVAVAAFPVQEPDEPEALPVTFPVSGPVKPSATKVPVKVPPELLVANFAELLWNNVTAPSPHKL